MTYKVAVLLAKTAFSKTSMANITNILTVEEKAKRNVLDRTTTEGCHDLDKAMVSAQISIWNEDLKKGAVVVYAKDIVDKFDHQSIM